MVVALGIIPDAIAFSIVAGVDPHVGLFGSVCILIVVSLLGGRRGMVSACTAGVALLMGGLMQSHGLSYLLAASILAGVFQIIWGYLRLAQQISEIRRACGPWIRWCASCARGALRWSCLISTPAA